MRMRRAQHMQPQRALFRLVVDELPLPGEKSLVFKTLDRLARTETHIAGKNVHSVCPWRLLVDLIGRGFSAFWDRHNSRLTSFRAPASEEELADFPQDRLDRLAVVSAERRLR